MRQICNRLYDFFELGILNFIQQQRKNNGRGKAEQQVQKADHNCVLQGSEEINTGKELLKMLKANSGTLPHRSCDLIILKCDYQSIHRLITEK